jgi:RNA polymerase sigma-70 factor (ECF subfamily)
MTEHPEKFPQTITELGNFVKKNQDKLVKHAYFRLGNREEAEDIVQEVMIRIYQDKSSKLHIEHPVPYVFRMVYNACTDHQRKNTKNNFSPLNGNDLPIIPDHSNRESELIVREEVKRVNLLLDSVPVEQAEVLRLRIIDELSFVEIAEILKIPVTTIKSRFSYGIIKLRTQVKNQEEIKYELH